MARLVLHGWTADAGHRPITAIKTIRDCTGRTLGAAKRAYDDCVGGDTVVVLHDLHEEQARNLYEALRQLSFRVEWQEC